MPRGNYSEAFKEEMVRKVLTRGGKSIKEIAEEAGIHRSVLDLWRRERTMSGKEIRRNPGERRIQDWTAQEKLQAVLETEGLSPEELGVYLRKKGLYSAHLEQWKHEILAALQEEKRGKRKNVELLEVKKKNKELERELRRKEKALAEATALLILKKKAALIWGKEEEEKWD